jgi:steroid delta-isomerase-like uncharacterized protein
MADTAPQRIPDDLVAAWSSHDPERVVSLFADDCVFEDVTFGVVLRGKKDLRAFAQGVFAGIPDFKIEITSRFMAGNAGGIEWTMSGTHKGDFPGMPATGKRFTCRGVTILEFQGDKIRRDSDYWDAAGVMRQVGLLPAA